LKGQDERGSKKVDEGAKGGFQKRN
jgi:hypothetical protein